MQEHNNIEQIKSSIIRLFSQELQYDETIEAGMERNQLRKILIEWATQKPLTSYYYQNGKEE